VFEGLEIPQRAHRATLTSDPQPAVPPLGAA
jgi:hypothetical protein